MNVYAFFEPLEDSPSTDYLRLIELWKKSWSFYGWSPKLLSLEDAKSHPLYQQLYDRCVDLPTLNNRKYELYCFLRWLAICQVGGWYADVDIMNYGFVPEDYGNKIVTCEKNPSIHGTVIHIPREKYDTIINEFLTFDSSIFIDVPVGDKVVKHVSDMFVLASVSRKINIDIMLGNHVLWKHGLDTSGYPLVHYHGGCRSPAEHAAKKSRSDLILEDERSKAFIE